MSKEKKWRPVADDCLQLIWRCPKCGAETAVAPEEATIPYCSGDDCGECETEYERAEILEEVE